ncbi:type IV secretory system conjugative DNA transfer family protein [Enterococcus faecalis]|uniref:type IV secretory system conjugative DNA transfer family protein n=2 Tax=Enterococcus faecalis TaxID=1351 RepID=UPI00215CF0E0|nr:type IV secretory system conjugative DNA transfer family protein [Enterococcus faecalis]MDB1612647.1 type IV secretory system conjugative DNA transfer family protein [Enterococcus faecalis]
MFDNFSKKSHGKSGGMMLRKKESSKTKKKNYEKAKQNSLRFLADQRFLLPSMSLTFLIEFMLGNWVIQNFLSLTSGSLFDVQWVSFKDTLFFYPLGQFPFVYFLLALTCFVSVSVLAYRLYTSFRSLEEEHVQGTMDFEKTTELDKQYTLAAVHSFTETEDYFDGKPGYPIGKKPQTAAEKEAGIFSYYVDTTDSNTITLAGTRQGKGIYFVDPFIDILTRARLMKNRASFVMTATKGDEPRKWYKTLKRRGYHIRVVNTVNQYYSDPIPVLGVFNNYYRHYKRLKQESADLKVAGKKSEALNCSIQAEKQLANAEKIITQCAHSYFREVNEGKDGGFWTKACRNLFVSVGMALADQEYEEEETSKVNPYTIYTVVNEMQKRRIKEGSHEFLKRYVEEPDEVQRLLAEYDGKSELDVFFGELPRTHPAKRFYDAIMASAPAHVTLGNIITHFDGDLQPFLMSLNAKMTAIDDGFDMEKIGFDREQPTAVFIVLSDADTSNNQLGVMYLEQIYQVLINRCNLEDESQCYRDVHFIYEEGGNLGVAINDLARKWTAGLSRHLFSHLVLQDIQQLSSLYDEDTKDIILGSTGNLAYIRTGSDKTNKYIAGRLGERSNYSKTRHKDPLSMKSTETESSERIDLLASYELERLREGESVILRINKHRDLEGNPIYQYPILNTYENDTNLIPFYEYRKMEKVTWEEVPVNNQFMEVELEELNWLLEPDSSQRQPKEVVPPIPNYKKPAVRVQETKVATPEEVAALKEEQTQLSTKKYQKQAKILEQLYHKQLERPVKEILAEKQRKVLFSKIKMVGKKDTQTFSELEKIAEAGTLLSYFSCLLSNFSESAVNVVIQQLKEWRRLDEDGRNS